MKYLILFNGPPGSGKDAISEEFIKMYPKESVICKFAESIRKTVFNTFPHINENNYDNLKNKPLGGVYGNDITLRQWIIKYAEEFMKPMFGTDIFASLTCERISKLFETNKCVIITDLGLNEEIETVLYRFHLRDSVKIMLVQLCREGHDFKDDSRYYINISKINQTYIKKLNFYCLENHSNVTLKELADDLYFYVTGISRNIM